MYSSSLENILNIAYINIRGQTGLNLEKQQQIEHFIRLHDILHCQEKNIDKDTFSQCNLISSSYKIFTTTVKTNTEQQVWLEVNII